MTDDLYERIWAAMDRISDMDTTMADYARAAADEVRADVERATPADDLGAAAEWTRHAMQAIHGYERDLGAVMDDDCEIGRIDDSRDSPSFRIKVGHIRRLTDALSQKGGGA